MKGDFQKPRWLSAGAQNIIKRILDPNPKTRIAMAEIKEDLWFKEGYNQAYHEDEEDGVYVDDQAFNIHELVYF